MPEVREVFNMSTQKVKPDPGFVDRQDDHQRDHERKRKMGAFAVVAAIALVAVFVVISTRSTESSTVPAGVSPTPVPIPGFAAPFLVDLGTGAKTTLTSKIGGASSYVPSPDGTKLLFSGCCTDDDFVTLSNIDGTDAHPVTPTDGRDAYAPRWSPDGTKIVYQLRDSGTHKYGSLIVEDVATGEKTLVATLQGSDPWWFMAPSFSPDGSTILFQLPRNPSEPATWDVWSVPVTGGEPTEVLQDASFARYFPDGKEIAFVSGMASDGSGGDRISIADADGSRRTLVDAKDFIFWPTMSPDGTRIAYLDGVSIYVVDVSTGETTDVADGDHAEWLDDDTLIVAP